jgi:dTDP-4-amino-4,6-dideoxygalactose transaminase
MKVPFFNLYNINSLIKKDVLEAVSKIIDDSSFVDGNFVKKFEEEFAEFCGAKYCIAVNNGTSALHLATKVSFRSSIKNAATPPNSFFATSESLEYSGFNPFFVDVDENFNIDIADLYSLQNYYGNILPVSLYGNPCNLSAIKNISDTHNKGFVHDACQAHGAYHKNNPICDYAELTCFSFYPSKNLGAFGEGGAIVTNNKYYYETIMQLKNHGQQIRYQHNNIGYNYRLNEIQAAVLSIKLKYLDEWTDERIDIAKRYDDNLKSSKVKVLKINSDDKCVYHLYPIFTEYKQKLLDLFDKNNIGYGFHYPIPIYDQLPYSSLNLDHAKFKYTEISKNQQISLPIYIGMSNQEIDYVCEIINQL